MKVDRINQLGKKLRTDLRRVSEKLEIRVQVTGAGSLAQIHFTDQKVTDWHSAATARVDLRTILHLLLMQLRKSP